MSKTVRFPTYNINYGDACVIVKQHLEDDSIARQTKLLAIQKVAELETHNGISKDELVEALRWLLNTFDFPD